MKSRRISALLCVATFLSSCGGGGSGASSAAPTAPATSQSPAPSATPSPTASACSLRARQDWAAAQLREWYLFPETLPATSDPSPFDSVKAYVDSLTSAARAQRRDRFFTYLTSIAEENAFFASGSNAGLGVRLSTDQVARRVFVAEAFEGAPALAAGIDRGTEIVAVGESAGNLRPVSDIIAAEGAGGVSNALGPSTPGTTRILRISDAAGTRDVSVTKADYSITPVSSRYGARVIEEDGKRIGYLNMRTFISTADPALRQAFADFRAAGITQFVIDLRYNGGGLVSIAELMGDLMGANRGSSDVFSYTVYRDSKSGQNQTRRFARNSASVAPTRIAFIGTGSSASASELVINSFLPYLRGNAGLIGANTYGKPVGQIAVDRSECDDRLRIVAFSAQNSLRQGDYYDGLAAKVDASCQAGDDIMRPLGDPQEASTRAALDFLAGRPCTRIPTGQAGQAVREGRRELLVPDVPTTAQREVPGIF